MKKPPLGVIPRYLHDERRFNDLARAIGAYVANDEQVPHEWAVELSELARRYGAPPFSPPSR